MEQELIVYIHGVSPRGRKGHDPDYRALHEGIRKVRPDFPASYCGVEWGWHDGAQSPKSHQLLSDAEEHLGTRALAAVDRSSDLTLNPINIAARFAVGKLRPLLMFNFSDMFYYTSADGKAAVRYVLAEKVLSCLGPPAERGPLSITLFGHSAGSVVAFDFLFFLFGPERPVEAFIDPKKVKASPSDAKRASVSVGDTLGDLKRLREAAQADRIRVRRLFTLGSPITPLAFRSDAILEILAKSADARLDSADYGLTRNPAGFQGPLKGPRLINMWDKDDPIGWPVEPLMTGAGTVVKDQYTDVSDSPTKAHDAYWSSAKVHKQIGMAW